MEKKIEARQDEDGSVLVTGVAGRVALRLGQDGGLLVDDMETARAIAHAILDADRHELEAKALVRVEIIDTTQQVRDLYAGGDAKAEAFIRSMPEHDYRFRDNRRPGEQYGTGTYDHQYTAAHIMASIEHDRDLKARGL